MEAARTVSWKWLRMMPLVLALAGAGLVWAQSDEPAAKADGMAALGKLVPLGHISKGVRLPSFADDGKLVSLIEAASVTRIDDERLSADKVVVQLISKEPGMDVRVDLPTAVYHMSEQVLRSADRSRVSRKDFEVEGDSLVFDSATSVGKMSGHVHTIIFDTEALSGQPKANQPADGTSQPSQLKQ